MTEEDPEVEAKLTWRTIQRDPTLLQECLVGLTCGHPVREYVLGQLEGSKHWCDRCIKYATVTDILVMRTVPMPEAAEKPMSEIKTPPTDMTFDPKGFDEHGIR